MTPTQGSRRAALKQGGMLAALVGCGLLTARQAQALPDASAFDMKTLDEALKALGSVAAESKEVTITAPEDDTVEDEA